MRILHIINDRNVGGAQSVLKSLIENWEFEEDEHLVLHLLNKNDQNNLIQINRGAFKDAGFQKGKFSLIPIINIFHAFIQFKPDIIQTWLYHSDLAGSMLPIIFWKTPIIWGIHHTTSDQSSVSISTWQIIRVLARISKYVPSKIICCTESAKRTHISLGYDAKKLVTINNGVDVSRFVPSFLGKQYIKEKHNLPKEKILIGMFARFHPQKDYSNLLSAAKILLQNEPDVHFILAGYLVDDKNESLTQEIKRLNIEKSIHLLGVQNDLEKLYPAMDIVTLTSAFGEALPVTICEAMSCGIPCVATDVGDVKMVIGDTGYVVQPGNSEELARAWKKVIKLSGEEYKILSEQSRNRIVELYNTKTMVQKYREVYLNEINKHVSK